MKSKIIWTPTQEKYLSQTYVGKAGSVVLFRTMYENKEIKLTCLLPGVKDYFYVPEIKDAKRLGKEIWKQWRKSIREGGQ